MDAALTLVNEFYEAVVQNLKPPVPAAPKVKQQAGHQITDPVSAPPLDAGDDVGSTSAHEKEVTWSELAEAPDLPVNGASTFSNDDA